MLLQECIHQRNAVVCARHSGSVFLDILAGRLPIFPDNHFCGYASSIIAVIVRQIVQRKDKGLFPLRKEDIPFRKVNRTILICRLIDQILQAHQHVTVFVHLLRNCIKLIHRGHPLAETGCGAVVPGESLIGIHHQRMVENMRNLIDVSRCQCGFHSLIFCNLGNQVSILIIIFNGF